MNPIPNPPSKKKRGLRASAGDSAVHSASSTSVDSSKSAAIVQFSHIATREGSAATASAGFPGTTEVRVEVRGNSAQMPFASTLSSGSTIGFVGSTTESSRQQRGSTSLLPDYDLYDDSEDDDNDGNCDGENVKNSNNDSCSDVPDSNQVLTNDSNTSEYDSNTSEYDSNTSAGRDRSSEIVQGQNSPSTATTGKDASLQTGLKTSQEEVVGADFAAEGGRVGGKESTFPETAALAKSSNVSRMPSQRDNYNASADKVISISRYLTCSILTQY